MVKTLVLVRHGDPEPTSESGSDADRRLTPAGARALAGAYPRTFALLGEDPELEVWSSPAVRALETASFVAEATGAAGIDVHQALYDQDLRAVLAELVAADASTVVLVGHVPFMDMLATQLMGSCPTFGKGAACAIDLPEGPSASGSLLWFVAGPAPVSWDTMATIEAEATDLARSLVAKCDAFCSTPEDPVALREFRVGLRHLRSVLLFLSPWQAKKQAKHADHLLRDLQRTTSRLRGMDILCQTVAGLVESGELGDNSLLPVACAKERSLECSSVLAYLRERHIEKKLVSLEKDLSGLRWKSRVLLAGLSADDVCRHFDHELDVLDEALFGLDLSNADVVASARHEAKELHYIASSLAGLLGEERALMSGYMDEVQRELGSLSEARRNQRLAEECARSPRFRGVRSDLGVVARDQREVVSAILAGLHRGDPADGPEDAE